MSEDIATAKKSFNVEGCVAFVTGTNRKKGIGRAIVDALVQGGAEKVYATARDASQLEELVESYHGKVVAVALDVTDTEAILKLGEEYPDVNLVVNNAGFGCGGNTLHTDPKGVTSVLEINFLGPMRIFQSFAANLKKDEKSSDGSCNAALVNVNSITSFIRNPMDIVYGCSKAACHYLTVGQRIDLGDNTLVVGLYPGPIDTDMMSHVDMEKATAASVASKLLEGLKEGEENIFPDRISKMLINQWLEGTTAALKQVID